MNRSVRLFFAVLACLLFADPVVVTAATYAYDGQDLSAHRPTGRDATFNAANSEPNGNTEGGVRRASASRYDSGQLLRVSHTDLWG